MNTVKKSFRLLSALLAFSMAAFLVSCGEDEDTLASADQQSVSSEASLDSYFEDAEDISSSVSFAADEDLGGRQAGSIKERDNRLSCATITIKKQNDANADTIVVDFGVEGCTDPKGNVRKGKIIIVYSGNRATVDSEITTTFDGFYVNGIKVEGTRSVSVYAIDNTSITHYITLTDGKLSWPDGSTASRSASHYRKWVHNATPLNILDDQVILLSGEDTPGTATGENREGVAYTMQITEDIVFKTSCWSTGKYLPASGEKILVVGSNVPRQITVNYGSGDCDNTITVTINGQSRTVTVSRG